MLTDHAPWIHREGVLWHEPSQCDLLLITLRKSEALLSPTGQRYIHHAGRGSRVLLLVREQRKQGSVTETFVCLGFARYVSHEGERPMAIRWRRSGRSRRRGCTAVVSHTSCCLAQRRGWRFESDRRQPLAC